MARWLEKFVNYEMVDRYMNGENLVHGFAVYAESLRPNESSRTVFKAMFMEWPVEEDPQIGAIATLRFPLGPTDKAVSAMGGNTLKHLAITGGDFLQPPPFDGRGIIHLPADPIAPHLYVAPTMLRAGAQLIKRHPDGSKPTLMATYHGAIRGWSLPEDTPMTRPIPLLAPNTFIGPQIRGQGMAMQPAYFELSDDNELLDVYAIDVVEGKLGYGKVPKDELADIGYLQVHTTYKGLPMAIVGRAAEEGAFRAICLSHDAYAAQERGFNFVEAGVYETIIPGKELEGLPTYTLNTPPGWIKS
ncbi:Uncharacterised protein [Actinomyces bovis]|uniref:Acetoacetate decarboxylase n=1 Tax=Actinomyces bovis TaxID=1658 RepID=A0ABY1VQB3_9ACTO|nr:hypothetical protein [Actinomyces bovis]SPT54318.1 Uncharacterised protein [Actinomyces bovis]VEG56317.1 Uncharacterised protein [Actinomyces israelii]